jgi:nicotinamide mononucleotide transporter
MNELVQFLLEPYQNASTFHILLEVIGAVFGIASVFFAKKENIWVYPTGIISTATYVYLLSHWALYGDLIINVYYTLMSIYGWYMWAKVTDDAKGHIPISRTNLADKLKAFGIFVFTSVFVIIVYRHYEVMPKLGFIDTIELAWGKLTSGDLHDFRDATPYIDTFTTGIFFAAMWLMANKKIENWTLWIIGDVVSIPLYLIKGYGFTTIQYGVFLVLAIMAYFSWRNTLKESDS